MEKQEIVSMIKNFVGRIDTTQKFHPRFLESVIERTLIEMYSDLYKVSPRLVDLYTKQYGSLTISKNNSTGAYYTTLPANIVNLPCKASGVRHIYLMGNSGNVFMPMDAREADLIFNTDVAVVSTKIGYQVRENALVEYWNAAGLFAQTPTLLMDLLIPFSEYEDSDVVLIPELTDAQGGTFIKRVLGILQVVPDADLNDDNANPAKDNNKPNIKQ